MKKTLAFFTTIIIVALTGCTASIVASVQPNRQPCNNQQGYRGSVPPPSKYSIRTKKGLSMDTIANSGYRTVSSKLFCAPGSNCVPSKRSLVREHIREIPVPVPAPQYLLAPSVQDAAYHRPTGIDHYGQPIYPHQLRNPYPEDLEYDRQEIIYRAQFGGQQGHPGYGPQRLGPAPRGKGGGFGQRIIMDANGIPRRF